MADRSNSHHYNGEVDSDNGVPGDVEAANVQRVRRDLLLAVDMEDFPPVRLMILRGLATHAYECMGGDWAAFCAYVADLTEFYDIAGATIDAEERTVPNAINELHTQAVVVIRAPRPAPQQELELDAQDDEHDAAAGDRAYDVDEDDVYELQADILDDGSGDDSASSDASSDDADPYRRSLIVRLEMPHAPLWRAVTVQANFRAASASIKDDMGRLFEYLAKEIVNYDVQMTIIKRGTPQQSTADVTRPQGEEFFAVQHSPGEGEPADGQVVHRVHPELDTHEPSTEPAVNAVSVTLELPDTDPTRAASIRTRFNEAYVSAEGNWSRFVEYLDEQLQDYETCVTIIGRDAAEARPSDVEVQAVDDDAADHEHVEMDAAEPVDVPDPMAFGSGDHSGVDIDGAIETVPTANAVDEITGAIDDTVLPVRPTGHQLELGDHDGGHLPRQLVPRVLPLTHEAEVEGVSSGGHDEATDVDVSIAAAREMTNGGDSFVRDQGIYPVAQSPLMLQIADAVTDEASTTNDAIDPRVGEPDVNTTGEVDFDDGSVVAFPDLFTDEGAAGGGTRLRSFTVDVSALAPDSDTVERMIYDAYEATTWPAFQMYLDDLFEYLGFLVVIRGRTLREMPVPVPAQVGADADEVVEGHRATTEVQELGTGEADHHIPVATHRTEIEFPADAFASIFTGAALVGDDPAIGRARGAAEAELLIGEPPLHVDVVMMSDQTSEGAETGEIQLDAELLTPWSSAASSVESDRAMTTFTQGTGTDAAARKSLPAERQYKTETGRVFHTSGTHAEPVAIDPPLEEGTRGNIDGRGAEGNLASDLVDIFVAKSAYAHDSMTAAKFRELIRQVRAHVDITIDDAGIVEIDIVFRASRHDVADALHALQAEFPARG